MVVPTYNEKENVRPLIEGLKRTKLPNLTVLFVDDSSPDGTADEVRSVASVEPWIRLKVRKDKKGLGSAYEEGFSDSLRDLQPDILVEMDADLQHPPEVLPSLVGVVSSGADVAVASRYVPGGSVAGWSLWRRGVSRGANWFARTMLRLQVRDATSGYRAFSRRAAEQICSSGMPAKGFEFQVAALKVLKTDMKIVEVPFEFRPRAMGESKLGLAAMFRFFVAVMRMSLRS